MGFVIPSSKEIYEKYQHLSASEFKEQILFLCFEKLRGILGGILSNSMAGSNDILKNIENGTIYEIVSAIKIIDDDNKITNSEYRESGNHSIDIDRGVCERKYNLSTKKLRNHLVSNYFSVWSMVLLGLAIIVASEYIVNVLAFVVGIPMVLISLINGILRFTSKKANIETKSGALSRGIIFVILGSLMIFFLRILL